MEYFKAAEEEGEFKKHWELLKFDLRKVYIETGSKLKREKKKNENDLIAKLVYLSSILPENLSEPQQAELTILQIKLDQFHTNKAKGAFVRSRAK